MAQYLPLGVKYVLEFHWTETTLRLPLSANIIIANVINSDDTCIKWKGNKSVDEFTK